MQTLYNQSFTQGFLTWPFVVPWDGDSTRPGTREESPPAMLPGARVRRQWFMTAEEGVRLRSSLFWENGPAGVCKAVFAELIAPTSTKLQGRGTIVSL